MGSAAELYFGETLAYSTKNYLDQWLFRNSEKLIQRETVDFGSGPEEIESFVFQSTVGTIIKRLELTGYTLEAAQRDLTATLAKWFRDHKEYSEEDYGPDPETIRALKEGRTVERWIQAFKIIVNEKIEIFAYDPPNEKHSDAIVNFMIRQADVYAEDFLNYYHYPTQDFNHFARVMLEAFPKTEVVKLDATDLVGGGWYDGFETIKDINKPTTRYFDSFKANIDNVLSFLGKRKYKADEKALSKLLFANLVSVLETYLADVLINTVVSFRPLMRRLVESSPDFKSRKIDASEAFRYIDSIDDTARTYLQDQIYHNISKVRELYRNILYVDFPQKIDHIYRAIELRHDLVHRNGKTKDDEEVIVSFKDVKTLADQVEELVKIVDVQVKNVYPSMLVLSDEEEVKNDWVVEID